MNRVLHSGDLGDIVYAMPIMRELAPCEVWLCDRPWTAKLLGKRAESVKMLLLSQPYVASVEFGDPPGDVVDISTFRSGGIPFGERLSELQSRWVNVPISLEPWIGVTPDPVGEGRVVVHRSPRYNNHWFPWTKIVSVYGDRLLCVGSREEHSALESACGRKMEWLDTPDMHRLACVISASDLFVGNQSSPCAVAIALGVRYFQETCLWTPDCLYPERLGSVHCFDGEIPGVSVPWSPPIEVDEMVTPPGGWSWSGGRHGILNLAVRLSGLTKQEVISHTVSRVPNFFSVQSWEGLFSPVAQKLVELSSKSA